MSVEKMACCGALTHVYSDAGHRQHKPGCRHYYGPGNPDFDAKFRGRWLAEMWHLMKDRMTYDEFAELITRLDADVERFVQELKESRERSS